MTTVVSDTTPINYLVLVGAIDVLPRLFQQVLIPPAVWRKLQHQKTPKPVFDWAASLPEWATIEQPLRLDASIGLGAGENEAISLAMERHIFPVLMDDRQAWRAAEARSLVPIGTINVLESADQRGLLDFEDAVAKLRETTFRIDQTILDIALDRVRRRKQASS